MLKKIPVGLMRRGLRDNLLDVFYGISCFLLFPTCLWLVIGRVLFVDRGLINIDFILLGCVIFFIPRLFVICSVFFITCLDLVFAFAPAYHFSLTSVTGSFVEMFSLQPLFVVSRIAIGLLFVAFSCGATLYLYSLVNNKRLVSACSAVLLILSLFVDALTSASSLWNSDAQIASYNVAFSTVNNLRVAIVTSRLEQRLGASPDQAEHASLWLSNGTDFDDKRDRKIVLIVVESLGLFLDPDLEAHQLRPLLDLKDSGRYVVTTGSVPFRGSTVPGELRELCGIRLLTVHPRGDLLPSAHCLPELMKRSGYETLAVHGFLGTVFSRNIWYPALDFDRIWFAPELGTRAGYHRRCGISFSGWCDEDVWRSIAAELSTDPERRQFVYWLTLSSHLPITAASRAEAERLCRSPMLASNDAVCGLVAAHNRLFAALSYSLREQPANGTRVLVVGDHAPPFLDQHSRAMFDSGRVPYVDIRPTHASVGRGAE